jgi:hypothetical protein
MKKNYFLVVSTFFAVLSILEAELSIFLAEESTLAAELSTFAAAVSVFASVLALLLQAANAPMANTTKSFFIVIIFLLIEWFRVNTASRKKVTRLRGKKVKYYFA